MRLILLFCLILHAPAASAQARLEGPVSHVRDGDTIEVGGIAIRLAGLTCDEVGSRLGDLATAELTGVIQAQNARCDLNGNRSYDRLVGRCWTSATGDIGSYLIKRGLCGRCARYDLSGDYIDVQSISGVYAGRVPQYCISTQQ
jgi:endonuclease YncB( thermonuclease family)